MENCLVVGGHNSVHRFVMCLNNVLLFLMLWEMVFSVLLGLMVRLVGQVGIGSLKTHFFFVVHVSCVRVVMSVRVSVTIWFTSLMLVKSTSIVGAFTIYTVRCIIGCMFTTIASMGVHFVAMMLLLKDIVVLVRFLGFVALHSCVLISWLALDGFQRGWLMFQTWVPFDRLIRLHLEDEISTVNVRLGGFESGGVGVECGIVTLVPSVGVKSDELISPVEVESLGLRIVSISLNVIKHQVPGHVLCGEIFTP